MEYQTRMCGQGIEPEPGTSMLFASARKRLGLNCLPRKSGGFARKMAPIELVTFVGATHRGLMGSEDSIFGSGADSSPPQERLSPSYCRQKSPHRALSCCRRFSSNAAPCFSQS